MTMQLLVLALSVFATLLALEIKDWGCAVFGGVAIVVQIAALRGM